MSKISLSLITTLLLALSLPAACADQDGTAAAAQQPTDVAAQPATEGAAEDSAGESTSLMDQPVDFSTPEKVEETLQKIREQEGEKTYKAVNSAMSYVLFYDLSVKNDKALLYKKLNGLTPRQIVEKMRR